MGTTHVLQYYDMSKYQLKAASIRTGGTLPVDDNSYDPSADLAAHSSAVKALDSKSKADLTKEDILELRRVQAERHEIAKMRALGLEVPREMGVRTERIKPTLQFDTYWQGP